jgi:hypothetical protein
MNDFDFDAMQKKRIAQGARHKKNGSKSHGCTLPSDLLTEAQKRKLNGPVVTLKLDEPMTWKDFKALPEDKRRLYLERLKELYQPSCSMLGQMFGVTEPAVSRQLSRLGVTPAYSRTSGTRPGATDRAKWDAFCNGVVGGKPGTPANTVTEAADDTVEPVNDAVETEEPVENAVPVTPGKITDEVIHQKLRGIDDFVNAILDRPTDEPETEHAEPAVPSAFRFTLNGVDNWESVFALLRGLPLPEKADIAIAVRTGK